MVRLRDSLSNLNDQVKRLLAALEAQAGLGNLDAGGAGEAVIAQIGADPAVVRLEVKENRKLSPGEIKQLVARYQAGESQAALARQFGLHHLTVRQHLVRQGIQPRPMQPLTKAQEHEVARLYVEQQQTIAELAVMFNVGRTAIRKVLIRQGVERRPKARRPRMG
jgi:transposase-like protein